MYSLLTRHSLRARLTICAFSICSFVCSAVCAADDPAAVASTPHIRAMNKLPLSFEANRGHADARAKFVARGRGLGLFLTDQGAVMALTKPAHHDDHHAPGAQPKQQATALPAASSLGLRYRFAHANAHPQIQALDPLPGHSNYIIGNDPKHWRTNIALYQRVRYRNIYPGVDVVYYGKDGQLEFDIEAAPGADLSQVRLQIDGADSLALDDDGNLQLHTALGVLTQGKPVVYQMIAGERRELQGDYVLRDVRRDKSAHEVAFRAADYDHRYALVFDPTLVFASLIGGSGNDDATSVAVDHSGNSYVAGQTGSSNFPTTTGAFQTVSAGVDAFVTKISADGTTLIYSTLIGGAGTDAAYGIAVDGAGNAYIGGYTLSGDFPTKNAVQPAISSNNYSGFITALNPTGSGLVYSTYYGGGNGISSCSAIAADSSGDAYATGITFATDLPATPGAFQTTKGGAQDAFVVKLGPAGTQLYATYLGGTGYDGAAAIAIDTDGDAYIAGNTTSSNINGVIPAALGPLGGLQDMLIAELNPTGSALVYATKIGGTGSDYATGIAVDDSHQVYFTGVSDSTNLPPTTPPQQTGGANEAYVGHLDDSGTQLYDFTWYGATDGTTSTGAAINLDEPRQSLYVVGQIQSKAGMNSLGNSPSTNPVPGLDCAGACAAATGAFVLQYTINPLTLGSASRVTGGGSASNAYYGGVAHALQSGNVAVVGSSDGSPPTTGTPHRDMSGSHSGSPPSPMNAGGDDLVDGILGYGHSLAPVVVYKNFVPPIIVKGQQTVLAITLSNPNVTASLNFPDVRDEVPGCIAAIHGASSTCFSPDVFNDTIGVFISVLGPGATCTATFAVQAKGQAGICTNETQLPKSSAGLGSPAEASLVITAVPTTTYSGGGAGSMSSGASWVGGTAPASGNDITFPTGVSQTTVTNNLPAAQTFNLVDFSGDGYDLIGGTFNLQAGIDNSGASNTVSAQIKANLPLVFTSDPAAATLNLPGGIDLNGHAVDFIGAGTSNVSGTIIGVGDVSGDGTGDVTFSASPTFSGKLNVTGGRLFMNVNASEPVNVYNVGTLRGTGTLGAVSVNDFGNIYPGTGATPTVLPVASLTVNSGSVELAFGASNASHSSITASGAVQLNGGTLQLDLATTAPIGTVFSNLITAPGTITGCFAQAAATLNVAVRPQCTASAVSAMVFDDDIFHDGFGG
jgi:Beta-propeller repeat